MPNWKKVIVSGSDATLNKLNLITSLTASGLNYPTTDGTSGQAMVTDGLGNLTLSDVSAKDAESTHIPVKNTSGGTINKGTPIYITGNVGGSERLEIAAADAGDPNKMPSVGLLENTLLNNEEGFVVQGGYLKNLDTNPIDGVSTDSNDTVYVKVGGGLTVTKPTNSDGLIQNIAKVARAHGSAGSLIVSSILRTNDVPNLPEGKIWVGDGNTITSSIVYLDETNSIAQFTGSIEVTGVVSGSTFSGSFVGDGSGLTGISAGATDIDGLSDGYTQGLGNVFLGTPATSLSVTSGTRNTVLGCNSGKGITSGLGATIVGYCAAPSLNSATIAIGYEALCSATNSSTMTFIGYRAGRNITCANYNTGVGHSSLYCNLTGQRNTAFGWYAGYGATGGSNTFIGACSGGTSTNYSSNNNTAVGTYSLKCGGGSQNTALGMKALCTNTSGVSNVVIGHSAGTNLTGGTLNIIIGQGAQASSANALYEITLGSSQTVVRIPGLNASDGDVLAYCSTGGLQSQGGFIASSAISSSFTTGSNVYGPYGANSILSASYALTASHLDGSVVSASYALTASYAATASIAIGGSNTQVQFNDNGDLGASPNLTFDGSTLSVTGAVEGSTTLTIGSSQTNSGTLSSIGGGDTNTIISGCGFIGAGCNNRISNVGGFIGAGHTNCIQRCFSTIVGGTLNCTNSSYGHDSIGGGRGNSISGTYSGYKVIAGGQSNTISNSYSGYSAIGGGYGNKICSNNSTIAGGATNTICAGENYGSIGGGLGNIVDGDCSTIAGGAYNCITGNVSVIAGGNLNTISDDCSTIAGGDTNTITGRSSFIGGGNNNTTNSSFAFIGAGRDNIASNDTGIVAGRSNSLFSTARCSVIGGGKGNTITGSSSNAGEKSFIGAGNTNCINGSIESFIGSGCKNCITGNVSVIAGGTQNTGSGACSFIGGGNSNFVSGIQSFVGAGIDNDICNAIGAFIGGGCTNVISGSATSCNHVIAGGSNNKILVTDANQPNASVSAIGGGYNNCITHGGSVIAGGTNHTVSAYQGVVVGGDTNTVSGCYGFIGAGRLNTVAGHCGFIGSGCNNTICSGETFATIGGGGLNRVDGDYSVTVGGLLNCNDGNCAFIGGGFSNYNGGFVGVIGGGYNHEISFNEAYSAILGGYCNKVDGDYGFIGGGCRNCICNNCSVIVGGRNHLNNSRFSFIGGGCVNTIDSACWGHAIVMGASSHICTTNHSNNFIGGGQAIHIECNTSNSTIGGGADNTICRVSGADYGSTIAGGASNRLLGSTCWGFIGGGSCNTGSAPNVVVAGGRLNSSEGNCSAILGGCGNTASGTLSGILGGTASTVSHTCSFIVGSNLTSTANCYTFMNNACVAGTTRTTTLVETSARKHKECILPLQDQVENLKKLEPVSFTWKEDKKEDIGLIAEDVEKVLPKMVSYEDNGELHGVQYSKLTAILIKAFQEQQNQIEELKEEVKLLKQNK